MATKDDEQIINYLKLLLAVIEQAQVDAGYRTDRLPVRPTINDKWSARLFLEWCKENLT